MGRVELAWLNLVPLQAGADRAMRRVAHDLRGQSTVEYALVGALVVIAAAGAMALLGDQVSSVFGHITNTLSGAAAGH
jgi:Flp pilus assembly pilin Flp